MVASPSVGCFLRLRCKNRTEAKYMKSKDLAILYEQFTYIKIKSCNAKREGNEKGKNNNKRGLISIKSNFARAAHFFVHFFAVVVVRLEPETL